MTFSMRISKGSTTCSRPRLTSTSRPLRVVRVSAQSQAKTGLAKFSDSIGLPTDDGVFGFTPFAEMWVGRWAQIGFVSSIVVEFLTGHGTLQQVGLPSPSTPMLITILAVASVATLVGTGRTVQRATSKKMSQNEIAGYKTFLGLHKEDEDDSKNAALLMKRKGDFTTPGNDLNAIAAAKSQGTPVDQFLSTNEIAEGQQASADMKAASVGTLTREQEMAEVAATESQMKAQQQLLVEQRAATAKSYEDKMYFGESGELAYARGVEITNGRWAMIGFFTAIVVESVTGEGIIGQVISIIKWSGLLGEKSGF